MQEKLEQERTLLRTLIDAIPDYIYVKERERRFVEGNIAVVLSLGGRTRDDIIGVMPSNLFTVPSTLWELTEQVLV